MTSHHDVAWVVAELRNFGSGDTLAFVNTSKLAIAATILEHQAKALSEAEANFAKLSEMALESELLRDRTLTSGEAWKARALAAESRLAEAEKERDEARADALELYQLGADVHICEQCSAWMTDDERAHVDVTLCPREAYGSDRFPDEKCFKNRSWLVEADRAQTREKT